VEEGSMSGRDYRPGHLLFDERRAEARARADGMDDHGLSDPTRQAFFHQIYDDADADAARVPWAKLSPHPLLVDFLHTEPAAARDMRALDVGCGLGDNAEALAAHGFAVTAFDLVERAVDWARQRFPGSRVDYCTADIFDAPAQWKNAFDLVHECYTIQSVTPRLHGLMMQAIGDCVAPGGRLVVIARSRRVSDPVFAPPWPLAREEFTALTAFGFRELDHVDIAANAQNPDMRDMRIIFEKV
jgi:2-polyprenyl-3-methyl-5-hydroxy-6-metoxy-1,4-benzoquinol methylase